MDGFIFSTVMLKPGGSWSRISLMRDSICCWARSIFASQSRKAEISHEPRLVILLTAVRCYQLRVFYERAAQNVLAALTRRVTAGAADLALPPFTISETGYVEVPHKNKYGQDYQPPSPNNPIYVQP